MTMTTEGQNLKAAVEESLRKDLDRQIIKSGLKTCLQGLGFIKRGFKLHDSDPSYKLRYLYALNFWSKETENGVQINRAEGNALIRKLKEKLNSKEAVYSEDENCSEIVDDFFFKERSGKDGSGKEESTGSTANQSSEQRIWYVTSKCDNAFYVKCSNGVDAEERVNIKEIACDYKLICPGDEVQVIKDNMTILQSVYITKSTGLDGNETREEKTTFITNLLTRLQSESGSAVVEMLRTRVQGIWNHIKNDEELFQNVQCVRSVIQLSFELSEKLSKEGEGEWFLEDLSSSLFFTAVLPVFIQERNRDLNGSDDITRLKSLLELMMKFSPQTATKILDVAKHLANVMHGEHSAGESSNCNAVEYLVHLGTTLAKSVLLDCEDDDTTDRGSTGRGKYRTREEKARFITNLLTKLFSQGESGFVIVNTLRTSDRGLWNGIKNDEELFKDVKCVKNVIRLSFELSQKLSKKSKVSCEWFLKDLSSSLFFTAVLPVFIQNLHRELNGDEDIIRLKFLLEFMMKFSPPTAKNTLEVAKHLANVMHMKNTEDSFTEENFECDVVEYLVHLAKMLGKSVSGCQDVDTTNCRWNDLPTIPTPREILSVFDLERLEAIKVDQPYESLEQYLDINYRLLREECFRDLCTGIQDFLGLEHKSRDAGKMKMYRIKLNRIEAFNKSQILLVLNCRDYYEEEKDSSEEQVDTSNQILYGSLMCISLNKNFDSLIWAAIVECELQSDPNLKHVYVKLCSDRNKKKNIDVLLELTAITNKGDYALMAESPTFYNAFGPCMDRLKETYENADIDMPLVDELVFVKESHPPTYTHDKEVKCDWSIIFDQPSGYDFTFPKDQKVSPIDQYRLLEKNTEISSSLDETQMRAVENFLQNRVSIIQGPPGTGKSFLGVKILRLMLSMEIHKRFDGPILIMTYKNFALDHFLEACLKFHPKIVRIGKAATEALSKINLRNVRHEKGINRKLLPMDREATANMCDARSKLKGLYKCLSNGVQLFLKAASEFHIRSLLTMSDDSDKNINEDTADNLLRKSKQKDVPKELKEHLVGCLKRWIPQTEMQERYQDHKETGFDHRKNTCGSTSSMGTDDDGEDLIDQKVLNKDRQQDAMEEDDIEESMEEDDIQEEEENYGNPLTDDVNIPFLYDNDIGPGEDFEENINLWMLTREGRRNFIRALQGKIVREFSQVVSVYEENAKYRQDIWDDHTVSILKEYDVIAMTVSGAATRLHLLDQLKPCAVVVEEAAEILEGQLVAVLPPSIQHLVMLGDQEQLKPRVNCYQLKKKKLLDCSMFERLVNNSMNFTQLGQQCRMRDDIADLLRELKIYKHLKTNQEKTCNNEPPDYIESSVYFVKHTEWESKAGSNSLYNRKEISLILDVAQKLMKNGFPPSDVTVLCPYRGQMVMMKSAFGRKSSDPTEEYLTKLKDINITTVDSFQGEENKIILLSLVRSNPKEKIGFLGVRNRICVAISRAQCGLYIFGNSSVYQTSQNWRKIIDLLTEKHKIGWVIPFKEGATEITIEEEKEPFSDNTKLSEPELTRLSLRVLDNWEEIAGLTEGLDKGEVDNVKRLDNVQYPQPKHKAKKILSMISDLPNFSREGLAKILKELGLHERGIEVLNGTLRSNSVEAGSAGPNKS